MSKKIGILTSGGDCAGLNAVIRAVTLRSVNKYGWQVFRLKDGTLGLMTNPLNVIELKTKDFDIALNNVLLNLDKRVAADGEGASKFVNVSVNNAKTQEDAKKDTLHCVKI